MTVQVRSQDQRQTVLVVKNVGSGSLSFNPCSPQIALLTLENDPGPLNMFLCLRNGDNNSVFL